MSDATTAADRKKLFKKAETFGSKPEDLTAAQRAQAITGYDLRSRIEALIAGITGKKIKTTFYGTGAATAEGMMILPTIPQARLFTREEAQILLGYTAHEISHQLETDFKVLNSIFADIEKPTRRERQLKEWWNAIEDYRIEKITRREFPGFPIFIGATRHYTAERFVLAVQSGNIMPGITGNPYRIGAVGLTWVGAILNGYPTQANDQALSLLDDDLEAWLRGTSDRLSKVETKKDALDLAEELLSELEDNQKDEDDQQDQGDQGGQGQQSQQNQPQQGGGQPGNGDSSDADSSDGGDGKEKDPESAGGKDEAGDAGDSDASEGQSSGEEDESKDDGQSSGRDADGDGAEGDQDPDASESDGAEAPGEGDEADDGDASEESSDQSDGDADGEGKEDAQSDEGAGSESGNDGDEGEADSDNGSDPSDDQGSDGSASSDGKGSDEGSDSDGDDGNDAVSSGSDGTSTEPQSGEQQDAPADDDSDGPESAGDTGKSTKGGQQAPVPRTTSDQADVEAEESDLTLDDILEQLAAIAEAMDNAEVSVENDIGGTEREQVQRSQRQYSELKRNIGSPGARTAGVVRRLLAARNQTKVRRNLEHGRLDLKRLVPIVNNSPNIYKEKTIRRDVNTAVSILVDNSISMTGHPIQVCQKAAIVLDSAITGTGTDLEITGFTGSECNPVIYQYRRFGQRSQAAAASLGSMHQVSMGGTPVSVPILEAHRNLMAHKAPRKIMIIISDGAASDPARAKEAHDVAVATGCIVLGIGIGPQGSAIGGWCANHQIINDIDELPNALAMIVQHAMNPQTRKAA